MISYVVCYALFIIPLPSFLFHFALKSSRLIPQPPRVFHSLSPNTKKKKLTTIDQTCNIGPPPRNQPYHRSTTAKSPHRQSTRTTTHETTPNVEPPLHRRSITHETTPLSSKPPPVSSHHPQNHPHYPRNPIPTGDPPETTTKST